MLARFVQRPEEKFSWPIGVKGNKILTKSLELRVFSVPSAGHWLRGHHLVVNSLNVEKPLCQKSRTTSGDIQWAGAGMSDVSRLLVLFGQYCILWYQYNQWIASTAVIFRILFKDRSELKWHPLTYAREFCPDNWFCCLILLLQMSDINQSINICGFCFRRILLYFHMSVCACVSVTGAPWAFMPIYSL